MKKKERRKTIISAILCCRDGKELSGEKKLGREVWGDTNPE